MEKKGKWRNPEHQETQYEADNAHNHDKKTSHRIVRQWARRLGLVITGDMTTDVRAQ